MKEILRENQYLPSMFFFPTERAELYPHCQPVFIFCSIFLRFRTNEAMESAKKIFYLQLNEIEDICEIPLSEKSHIY